MPEQQARIRIMHNPIFWLSVAVQASQHESPPCVRALGTKQPHYIGYDHAPHRQRPCIPPKTTAGQRGRLTSSLSCTWMKRGRAKPTWASSGMATLYSELLNSGALSLTSMTRMLKVVVTVALEGVRSSFSSVPCEGRNQQGSRAPFSGGK